MDPHKRESFRPETVEMLLRSDVHCSEETLPSFSTLPYLWLTCMQSALTTVKLSSVKSQGPASGQLNVCTFLSTLCPHPQQQGGYLLFQSVCPEAQSLKGEEFSEACANGPHRDGGMV